MSSGASPTNTRTRPRFFDLWCLALMVDVVRFIVEVAGRRLLGYVSPVVVEVVVAGGNAEDDAGRRRRPRQWAETRSSVATSPATARAR
jgi:hypothetical protein